ncbi:MAG: zinc ribbon domain-containing protein [Mycobacterium pseudokansasii]|uniref:zinc ribbon domain-containing protein n=1 Tax=Mycobacterium pseudokansasii TaxID=2341080 RepID=UPI00056902EF|nr:zinc ribbon domain-containing protein [Mycobacterium pseudokansasii]MBY0387732.1 zinc ribbon domain-containing protein [Mycobacterium pseudokansasii]
MPTYLFRCAQGCPKFVEQHPMASVPDGADCPQCACPARRIPAVPMVGIGRTAAMQLHDRTRATADAPQVVSGLPPARRSRSNITMNPLHRALPRP